MSVLKKLVVILVLEYLLYVYVDSMGLWRLERGSTLLNLTPEQKVELAHLEQMLVIGAVVIVVVVAWGERFCILLGRLLDRCFKSQ